MLGCKSASPYLFYVCVSVYVAEGGCEKRDMKKVCLSGEGLEGCRSTFSITRDLEMNGFSDLEVDSKKL